MSGPKKTQREKFEEAAQELEPDQSEERFDRLKRVHSDLR